MKAATAQQKAADEKHRLEAELAELEQQARSEQARHDESNSITRLREQMTTVVTDMTSSPLVNQTEVQATRTAMEQLFSGLLSIQSAAAMRGPSQPASTASGARTPEREQFAHPSVLQLLQAPLSVQQPSVLQMLQAASATPVNSALPPPPLETLPPAPAQRPTTPGAPNVPAESDFDMSGGGNEF